jgi:hypothetical protein
MKPAIRNYKMSLSASMQKIFTLVDEERGIVQVTTDDERFYIREAKDPATGLPTHTYLPSVTWICQYAPKGIGYYRWLADKGWNEAEAIKRERGKYGSRVHWAVEALLNGVEVKMDSEFNNPETNQLEQLTFEEYNAVCTFKAWWDDLNAKHDVEIVEVEYTIWNEKEGFAGTVDLLLRVDGQYVIIDLKTSKQVHLAHMLQVSAYKHSLELESEPTIAILQLGYERNKNGYKYTEVEDKWVKFLAAREFWREEHDGTKPFQKDYPLSVSLNLPAAALAPEVPAEKPTKTKKK